jgi:hypothetical protein
MKIKFIIEGVQENSELYQLTDLILEEFSKIPEDRLFDTTLNLNKFKNNNFKYIKNLVESDIEVEIAGRKSYYSGPYKLIALSETEYLSAPEGSDIKKIYRNILVHELQHAYDDLRSKGKYTQDKQSQEYYKSKYKSHYSYLKLPHEVWARFAELAEHITIYIRKSDLVGIVEDNLRGWEYLDEPMKRRILKSAYKLYDIKREEHRSKLK